MSPRRSTEKSHRSFLRSRRVVSRPVHRLIPCTTPKPCSDSPPRRPERMKDRHILPTPADSAWASSSRTIPSIRPPSASTTNVLRVAGSFPLRVALLFLFRRLVDHLPSDHGQQHLLLVNALRRNLEQILIHNDQVG